MHRFKGSIAIASVCFFGLYAQAQPPPEAKNTPGAEAAASGEVKKPEPSKEKEFAEVVKEAAEIKGLFSLYRTEQKVYLELRPDQLDQVYLLSLTCDSGIGEQGLYAAAMWGETPVVFRKRGKSLQVIAKNPRFYAQPGTPMGRFVERSFSDSVLGIAPLESKPHPERNSLLVDLGALMLADLPMLAYELEATFRIPYRFDSKNSFFGTVKGYDKNMEIGVEAHYATERPPLPPLRTPGSPPPPTPPPPRNLADIRSMFFQLRYSLSELPNTGYRPRLADDRVGHFLTQVEDYSTDVQHESARRYVNRWHLEKQDPDAALSPPREPIVFWMENTIPVQYRDAIRDGALMWNAAFEKIGFQDAIVVKQQPDDPDWDAADIRYSTIRWFAGTDAGFAQGPSRANPFTGQIYDADIRFSESMVRFRRQSIVLQQNPLSLDQPAWSGFPVEKPQVFRTPWSSASSYFCDYAGFAAREAAFAMDVLAVRNIDPDSPEAEKFVYAWLKEISAHEVGHTLGLRHNFRASTIHTFERAQDPEITEKQGLTGSVMDYIPTNLAARGEKQGEYHQSTLGPYDYWAIEYAYKPIPAGSTDDELPELQKIAARGTDPMLAYATDEDAGIGPEPYDMDPLANRGDLGSDPLKFYARRVRLSEEIWENMEAKLERPGEGYQVLRRSFLYALGAAGNAIYMASKYVGGVYHHRDHIGDPNSRLPFQPAPASKQREALRLVRDHLFAADAFRFSPNLLNKLNNERFSDFTNFSRMWTRFDVPIHEVILSNQKRVLDRLYDATVLKRILDSEVKVADPAQRFRLSDLFMDLQDSIWEETKAAAALDINSYRRTLQREHLRKLIDMVLRGSSAPEDARTLSRHSLKLLLAQLQGTLSNPRVEMPLETRLHLEESAARIEESLKANMQRTAF